MFNFRILGAFKSSKQYQSQFSTFFIIIVIFIIFKYNLQNVEAFCFQY